MRKISKIGMLAGLLALMFLAAGCRTTVAFSPKSDGLYISEDGKISSAFVVDVDQDYYSESGMKAFCEEEVIAYNRSKGASAVAYASAAEKEEVLPVAIARLDYGKKAVLVLDYAGADDYMAFNVKDETTLKTLMFAAAKNTTGLPDTTFVSVEDGSKIKSESVIGDKKLKILMIQGMIDVQVDGKIVYTSENVKVTGTNEAVTSESGYSYILFK